MAGKVESVLHATNSTFSRAKYAVAIASLLHIGEHNTLLENQDTWVVFSRAKPVGKTRIKTDYDGFD